MDLFLQGCQGLGLALSAGAVAGAVRGALRLDGFGLHLVAVLAAVAGGLLFGLSLEAADHPAWPGWPVGAAAALGSLGLTGSLVAGAGRRAGEEGSPLAVAGIVVVAALVLAGLSVLIPPASLAALGGGLWLATARRRRAGRKYEGLRVLR